MNNPFRALIRSRKFWLLVLDIVISTAAYAAARTGSAALQADVKFGIATLQPIFIFVISAIAYEDAAAKRCAQ